MTDLPMTCSDVRANLHLFVGGDLEHPDDGAVRAHLESCEACREESRRATDARRALLAAQEPGKASPGVWEGVRATLLAEGALTEDGRLLPASRLPGFDRTERTAEHESIEAPTSVPSPVRHLWRLAGGMAAAALVGLGLWTLGPERVSPDSPGSGPGAKAPIPSIAGGPSAPATVAPVADHSERQASELKLVSPEDSLMSEYLRTLTPDERERLRQQEIMRWLQQQQQIQSLPSNQNGSKAASNRRVW